MLIHPWDAARDADEWRQFAIAQGFGHLIAAGTGRRRPVVVPTQFVFDRDTAPGELADITPGELADTAPGESPDTPPGKSSDTPPGESPDSAPGELPYTAPDESPDTAPNEAMGTVLLHLARPNPIWPALAENPYAVLAIAGDWAYVPSAWKAVEGEDPALGVPTTYYAAVQLSGEVEIIDDPAAKLDLLRKQLATLQPDGGHADPAAHYRELRGIRGIRLTIDDVQAKFKYGGNVDAAHRRAVADRLSERGALGDGAARAHLIRRLERETPCP